MRNNLRFLSSKILKSTTIPTPGKIFSPPQTLNSNHLRPRTVPVQLRYSGDNMEGGLSGNGSRILIDNRVRKGPYFHLSERHGAWCYQVYNRTYHPRAYTKPEDGGLKAEYDSLVNDVTMWNVAVERQIMVKGPDAMKFVDYVITRRANVCETGASKQVVLCNHKGGVVNDPILLRPNEDEWWFSLSDSDVGIYLQGVNHKFDWNVNIEEIDVSPVQIQGPKSTALMKDLVGEQIEDVPYFGLLKAKVGGCDTVISRTGWSTERGYEIYLYNSINNAERMWDAIIEAGHKHKLRVTAPGHHRRIEAGILSWGQDMDIEINPYECGLGYQVNLKKDNFIGKKALEEINKKGVTHKLAGIKYGGKPIEWYLQDYYHVLNKNDELVGYLTSGWHSYTLGQNIGFAMLPVEYTKFDTELKVVLPDLYKEGEDNKTDGIICQTPFKMPHEDEQGLAIKQGKYKL